MADQPIVEELALLSSLEGKWQYQCTVSSWMGFPDSDGKNCHGGICELKVVRKPLTTEIEVSGTREWHGEEGLSLVDRSEHDMVRYSNPTTWKSVKGALISNYEFMYQYQIGNEGVCGMTFVKFGSIDGSMIGGNAHLKGEFYYLPTEAPSSNRKKGTKRAVVNPDEIIVSPPPSDIIISNKRQQRWLRVHGEIEMKKINP